MIERRAHPRLLDCGLVVVHWNDDTRDLQQLGNVDDVSLGGVRVRVDHPIPVGSTVKISYESLFNGMLTGTVKHHLERSEGIFLSIGFDMENVDSMLLFYPELFSEVD
jgi:hypothetical protein